MIEPEIAFCDLEDDMRCAEDYVQFCCKFLLENCGYGIVQLCFVRSCHLFKAGLIVQNCCRMLMRINQLQAATR